MSGPDIDTNEKNAVGGLDSFVLNVALVALGVFPTLYALIATPWRLAPLLLKQEPDGRRGMLLGPGVFFVASITVIMLAAGSFATPETIESNTGLIGPAYSKSVSTAVAAGDAWRVAALIGPIYVLAVIIGAFASGLGRFIGPSWTIAASLRASFYQMAASICWILVSSTMIDATGVSIGAHLSQQLYAVNAAAVLALPVWQYFWFFKKTGNLSVARALGLAVLTIAVIGSVIFFIDQLRSILSA